ncbi:peptidase M24, structural domain-containing protein [Pseudoneurospora amorphoporcata]|uniref:Xaa-Pro aminopeptidase n=1 Tax=Pseudoneurospora amorphoporcata TaxID=241081 RepID=A0AAN6P131_9PEZI|nr:peptidase M24, structural domain-containing protein [Pseudoneurospora amorphoporcata]
MKLPRVALRQCSRQLRPQNNWPLQPCLQSAKSTSIPASSSTPWRPSRTYATTPPSPATTTTTTVSAADLEFGQPVYETHPHMLQPGELTPGITAQEYHERRSKLAFALPENGIAILASSELKYRSGAVFFPFRQDSNFLYLTGFSEPDSLAIIQKTGPKPGDYVFHLFCRPKDPRAEQWSGPWSGLQAAEDVFNADFTGDIARVESLLPPILRGASTIYTDITPSTPVTGQLVTTLLAHLRLPPSPLAGLVHSLRAIKSPAEISNMRHAGRVSGRALTSAMKRSWSSEKDLESYLNYAFTSHGLSGPAYVPVVAGGPRGNMIHYVHNSRLLKQDEMVLVDAGGEYGTYITDITRTWPVNGKFSAAQRDLYEAVLTVQRQMVSLCREDASLSLDQIHRATEAGLREQLVLLGFDVSGGKMDVLFPHHVGHYVGLDVHDTPGYSRGLTLRQGHAVTIEPGVYVPVDDERFPQHFRGLAVRIEDSVVVDVDSPLILTTEAVKEVVDIEALRD